jgi:hypothetical protein
MPVTLPSAASEMRQKAQNRIRSLDLDFVRAVWGKGLKTFIGNDLTGIWRLDCMVTEGGPICTLSTQAIGPDRRAVFQGTTSPPKLPIPNPAFGVARLFPPCCAILFSLYAPSATLLLPKSTEEADMHRFFNGRTIAPLIVMAILLGSFSAQFARADDFNLDPDQIRAALHTTTDIDKGFIDKTVSMVQAGTLPRSLFTSTFIWARKKPVHRFQYFKAALIKQAADIGISL